MGLRGFGVSSIEVKLEANNFSLFRLFLGPSRQGSFVSRVAAARDGMMQRWLMSNQMEVP